MGAQENIAPERSLRGTPASAKKPVGDYFFANICADIFSPQAAETTTQTEAAQLQI